VQALNTVTHLFNRHPTKLSSFSLPTMPSMGAHRPIPTSVFLVASATPNMFATTAHKLAPRSSLCGFLDYSPDQKGYHCLNLSTNCVIISSNVIFDESSFPFAKTPSSSHPDPILDFLDNFHSQDSLHVI
jgi:hypothetical protein